MMEWWVENNPTEREFRLMQVREVVTRQPHKLKIGGANPPPATAYETVVGVITGDTASLRIDSRGNVKADWECDCTDIDPESGGIVCVPSCPVCDGTGVRSCSGTGSKEDRDGSNRRTIQETSR